MEAVLTDERVDELAEGEDLAEERRVVVEDELAVVGLRGQHHVGPVELRLRQRPAAELLVAGDAARREGDCHLGVDRVVGEAVGAGRAELDRRVTCEVACGQLHEGAAADVGGADEEDLEGFLRRLGFETALARLLNRWLVGGLGGLGFETALARLLNQRLLGGEGEVEVAGAPEGDNHVVEGVGDGAAGGVDADIGVVGHLVGAGDAGELRDLPGAGLRVEALAVAALALLERGGDVDEEERSSGLLDHRADLLPRLVEGGDRADDRQAAVAADLGGDPADPADVGLPVCLGEGQSRGEVAAHHVAVEAGDGAAALLEDLVHERASKGGLAAAGKTGEEQHEPLLVGCRTVRGHHVGRHLCVVALGVVGQRDDRVVTGVGRQHLHAESVVGVRLVVGGQRHRDDHGVRQRLCYQAGSPDQRDRREVGGAGADQRHQHHRPEATDLLDLGLGEGVGDRDPGVTGVLLTGLSGSEVQVAEGSVLGMGQRLDTAAGHRHTGQREPLGVDQLDAARQLRGPADIVRKGEGDRASFLVEGGQGGEGSGREELEVVELARGRAELREGTHLSILTEVVEFQGMAGPGLRSRSCRRSPAPPRPWSPRSCAPGSSRVVTTALWWH